jgi:hypothetical protein
VSSLAENARSIPSVSGPRVRNFKTHTSGYDQDPCTALLGRRRTHRVPPIHTNGKCLTKGLAQAATPRTFDCSSDCLVQPAPRQ